ncbi:MAG: 50S ribosomal protein L4 [Bacteroidia bacterium]
MELEIINSNGEKTGKKLNLPEDVFGLEPNDHAIYLDVKRILANKRQGTHSTKERSFVKGSTKKLRKQKGTGAARVGDIKNPIFRGGGRAFGPRPRDYEIKLNKKVKQLARKSALSYKAKNNQLLVLEDFQFDAPKTKSFSELLTRLQISDKKTLMVLKAEDRNIMLSARNLPNTLISTADKVNTYALMNCNTLVLMESSVNKLSETFNRGK